MEPIQEVEDEEKMKAEEIVSNPESSERNAKDELESLASALMAAAAAGQPLHGDEQGGGAEAMSNDAETALMMMKPLVKKARKLLYRRMRVGVEDGRVFVGKFHCLDKQGNIILYDTVEYRQISPASTSLGEDGEQDRGFTDALAEGTTTEQRSLGLVLIPARCRTSCHIECSLPEQFSLLSI